MDIRCLDEKELFSYGVALNCKTYLASAVVPCS